jgi:hypothetical protein
MATLRIEAGQRTEEVVGFVLNNLSDEALDEVDIVREKAADEGLVSEPITVAAVITLTATGVLAITRLIELYMEHNRQISTLQIVANGFSQSSEAGRSLAELAKAHAQVSVSFGITHADKTKSSGATSKR